MLIAAKLQDFDAYVKAVSGDRLLLCSINRNDGDESETDTTFQTHNAMTRHIEISDSGS
jgi:hypothetical protein